MSSRTSGRPVRLQALKSNATVLSRSLETSTIWSSESEERLESYGRTDARALGPSAGYLTPLEVCFLLEQTQALFLQGRGRNAYLHQRDSAAGGNIEYLNSCLGGAPEVSETDVGETALALRVVARRFRGNKIIFCGCCFDDAVLTELYYFLSARDDSFQKDSERGDVADDAVGETESVSHGRRCSVHFDKSYVEISNLRKLVAALARSDSLTELTVDEDSLGTLGLPVLVAGLAVSDVSLVL